MSAVARIALQVPASSWRDPAIPLEFQRNASRVNRIMNHPDIYHWCKGGLEVPLDVSNIVGKPGHVFLLGEHGGCWFRRFQPCLWNCHVFVLPLGRGEWVRRMSEAMKRWMFFRTDALEIVARVPRGNIAAKATAKLVGGVYEFTHDEQLPLHGKNVPVDIYRLLMWDWVKVAPWLEERGQWFHDELQTKYRARGLPEPVEHDDDPIHNRYVGAAAEMILGGQPVKGQAFYNRWAHLTYSPAMEIPSLNPLVLKIRDKAIRVVGNSFEVI